MRLETGLPIFLKAAAGISSLVADRIYAKRRPQSAKLPHVVFSRISTTRQPKFCGTDKLVAALMQIDTYAIGESDAAAVATAVRLALIDFQGQMGDVAVDNVFLENESSAEDPEPGNEHFIQTFTVWYSED